MIFKGNLFKSLNADVDDGRRGAVAQLLSGGLRYANKYKT